MSTYLEAVKDVGAMISDPDAVRYKTRIQEHLKRAMSELLKAEGFSEADYPDCEKLKTDLVFSTNPYNAAIDSFIRLIKVYPSPLVSSPQIRLQEQDTTQKWLQLMMKSLLIRLILF